MSNDDLQQHDTTETKHENDEQASVDGKNNDDEVYQKKLINRVVVSQNRNRPLSFYVDRSRRILRLENQLTVTGFGGSISMACTLVEVLKRQEIAKIKSINTGMDVQPILSQQNDYVWGKPVTQITFVLERGKYADCVQDYHQRKVIEIFEAHDKENKGVISKEEAKSLKLGDNFYADEEHKQEAEKFLNSIHGDNLDLPNFIRYASRLIHPLLKDRIFKQVLKNSYSISADIKPQ